MEPLTSCSTSSYGIYWLTHWQKRESPIKQIKIWTQTHRITKRITNPCHCMQLGHCSRTGILQVALVHACSLTILTPIALLLLQVLDFMNWLPALYKPLPALQSLQIITSCCLFVFPFCSMWWFWFCQSLRYSSAYPHLYSARHPLLERAQQIMLRAYVESLKVILQLTHQ